MVPISSQIWLLSEELRLSLGYLSTIIEAIVSDNGLGHYFATTSIDNVLADQGVLSLGINRPLPFC